MNVRHDMVTVLVVRPEDNESLRPVPLGFRERIVGCLQEREVRATSQRGRVTDTNAERPSA